VLSGKEIQRQRGAGKIVIEPALGQANANSYNLRLGPQILIYKKTAPLLAYWADQYDQWLRTVANSVVGYILDLDPPPFCEPLDMAVEEETVALEIPSGKGLVLWPGMLYLGHTLEYTETHGFVPCIEGRSSVGRLGMCVHATAGFGDVGFRGDFTLEMSMIHALRVYPGTAVCQIAYYPVEGETEEYQGKYQGQRGPKASRLWKEFERKCDAPQEEPRSEQQRQRPP